ncbi:hypothetical protein F0562_014800 [Nyssa sinensis]|uniref:Uncharacterized protein n=1 Tax=Nyssa sinensis TaxID=561372 RepID=A0A5J4ZRT7_9ASTE|nr:hypothetical protein F0562_014800 [Nyssa sinensis]
MEVKKKKPGNSRLFDWALGLTRQSPSVPICCLAFPLALNSPLLSKPPPPSSSDSLLLSQSNHISFLVIEFTSNQSLQIQPTLNKQLKSFRSNLER